MDGDGELHRQKVAFQGVIVDSVEWVSSTRPAVSENNLNPIYKELILRWMRSVYKALVRCDAVVKNPDRAARAHMSACWTFLANCIPFPEDKAMPLEQRSATIEMVFNHLLYYNAYDRTQPDPQLQRRADAFFHCMMNNTNGRPLFYTSAGRFGIGAPLVKPGDKVAVFLGANVPVLMRNQDQQSYRIVGELYIIDIMGGEIFEKEHKVESIVIE
jgi:hypothetical protein